MAITKAKAKATTKAPAVTERHCPACGKLHGSSLVPAADLDVLRRDGTVRVLSDQSGVETYRVHYCGGTFHVQPHEKGATT